MVMMVIARSVRYIVVASVGIVMVAKSAFAADVRVAATSDGPQLIIGNRWCSPISVPASGKVLGPVDTCDGHATKKELRSHKKRVGNRVLLANGKRLYVSAQVVKWVVCDTPPRGKVSVGEPGHLVLIAGEERDGSQWPLLWWYSGKKIVRLSRPVVYENQFVVVEYVYKIDKSIRHDVIVFDTQGLVVGHGVYGE